MPDNIQLYKPTISIAETYAVDETLEDRDLSFLAWSKLLLARKISDISFLSIGKLLKLFRDRKLYKTLDYETFEQFLASEELSMSRERAYLCIRVYDLFVEKLGLSQDDAGKMGITRLQLMFPLVKDIENKEEAIAKVEELSALRYNDFVKTAKEEINLDGKPTVYFSEEISKWIVSYYGNITHTVDLGEFVKKEADEENNT
jgi:hypothetical protein